MTNIGTVTAVINENVLLVKADQANVVNVGDTLTVFARIENDRIREITGLDHLDVPKGEIRITSQQSSNIFMAERFRHPSSEYRVSSPLSSGLLGMLLETKTPLPGNWSASFDEKDNLNLPLDHIVRRGDFVGKT
jgi:hypothetical protein